MKKRPSSNLVRIISGKWRGRKLPFPDAPDLRPTADRARETLFSWLSPLLPNARCLDLFAGSASLGLEALSRGASFVTFVELRSQVAERIEQHIQTLDANARVIRADARTWLKQAQDLDDRYDLIFLDPPFASKLLFQVLSEVCELTASGGCIYIERPAIPAEEFACPNSWAVVRQTRVGNAEMRLIRRIADFT